ncbi:MAG: DUF3592 domain-containing protein [Anaerolineae bacterium]|nr:DUF3592 domain-containing protein [Anaerolineae bacterium]
MPDFAALMGDSMRITLFLTLLPVALVVLVLLLVMWRGRRRAQATQTWASAGGRILSAQIEMKRGQRGYTPYPAIVYEYAVDGRTYHSTRINAGLTMGGTFIAQQTLDRYPPGSPVTVYYNPANPAEAVLEQNAPSAGVFKWMVIFIIFSVVCPLVLTVAVIGLAGGWINQVLNSVPR